jgi:Phage integrase family
MTRWNPGIGPHVEQFSTDWVMCDEIGHQMGRGNCTERSGLPGHRLTGLPDAFQFHDLRHYYASLLINSRLDVKVVQARLRHASAKTTLDTYGHLWPDSDETTRAAISGVITARSQNFAATVRPADAVVKHLP